MSPREHNIVANLVWHHRHQSPSTDDENFKSVPQKDRFVVTKLSAPPQLADSMDISHTSQITDLTLVENKSDWRMKIHRKSELMLEKWAFNKRKSPFQEVFGVKLEMD